MAILVDLYDSRSLSEAVNIVKTPEPYILSQFFGGPAEPHDRDTIDYEVYRGSEEIASFVHADDPNPRNVKKDVIKEVKTFKLPRTYESKFFTAQELAKINAIGQIYSTAQARKAAQMDYIATEIENLKNRVVRLKEKMACEAISTGKIIVNQDNISFDYDFQFVNGKQLVTLAAGDLWSASTSDPSKNIRAWKKQVSKLSGVAAKKLILGSTAAEKLLSNEKALKELDNNNFSNGRLLGDQDPSGSTTYLGKLAGVEVWEYHQSYVNTSGNAVDMIPTDRAVLVGESRHMRVHYGAIDVIQNKISTPILAEYYLEVDERSSNSRGIQWNLEQKSLPVIHDSGLIVSAKVV